MNIPVEIFQHYNSTWLAFMLSEPGLTSFAATQMQSHMGLLPQLERAWISIDSGLFLWDYIDGYVFVRAHTLLNADLLISAPPSPQTSVLPEAEVAGSMDL